MSEIRIAELLERIDVGAPSLAYHSVLLPSHAYKRMGEIDFLLIWDDCVLVIEVKGGRVQRSNGKWAFTNRFGETTWKKEGPFDQARSAMWAIEKRFSQLQPPPAVALGYVVITPDIDLPPGVEWDPAQYIGASTMSAPKFTSAIRDARKFALAAERGHVVGGAYRTIVNAVRPDFDRVPGLRELTDQLEREYVRLAEDQLRFLDLVDGNARLICEGGAGTGKTLLAVEAAKREAAKGNTVLVTCKSPKVLQLFTRSLDQTNFVFKTFDQLQTVTDLLVDCLIVDEAQDLIATEALVQLDSALHGGLDHGRWRIFLDSNNQASVDGDLEADALDYLEDLASKVTLTLNCRNTGNVIQTVKQVLGADIGTPLGGPGPKVEYVDPPTKTFSEAAVAIDGQLNRLRDSGLDLGDVAIVTMKELASESAAMSTKAWSHGQIRTDPVRTISSAWLCTAADIKGLETKFVLVVDLNELQSAAQRSRFYVAMTRPRVGLWIQTSAKGWKDISDLVLKGATNVH